MRKYIGGFENTGKGSFDGDGKDKAMRTVATSFIGEAVRHQSSTVTSFTEIFNKNDLTICTVFKNIPSNCYSIILDDTKSICMLARNVDFRNKPLYDFTKERILQIKDRNFIVGDCPNVDSFFIDYLDEINARYFIFHCGDKSRI
jgi:hypothetical protein